jgi:hypothetical protein
VQTLRVWGRLPLGFARSDGFLKVGPPDYPIQPPLFLAASQSAIPLRLDAGTPDGRQRFTETDGRSRS